MFWLWSCSGEKAAGRQEYRNLNFDCDYARRDTSLLPTSGAFCSLCDSPGQRSRCHPAHHASFFGLLDKAKLSRMRVWWRTGGFAIGRKNRVPIRDFWKWGKGGGRGGIEFRDMARASLSCLFLWTRALSHHIRCSSPFLLTEDALLVRDERAPLTGYILTENCGSSN